MVNGQTPKRAGQSLVVRAMTIKSTGVTPPLHTASIAKIIPVHKPRHCWECYSDREFSRAILIVQISQIDDNCRSLMADLNNITCPRPQYSRTKLWWKVIWALKIGVSLTMVASFLWASKITHVLHVQITYYATHSQ